MIASDKAKQLVENFSMDNTSTSHRYAKKFALIAVDYILDDTLPDDGFGYWQQVKKEIELL